MTSAADFRAGGTRRSRMPILDRASLWVTPLVKATGLRTVKMLLGDGNATPSSDGGWMFVTRPRTTGFTTWEGRQPYVMTIPIMLDGFAGEESQEGPWEDLRSIFRNGVGPERQPSPVSLTGAVPLTHLIWVIQNIESSFELRRAVDAHRIRIVGTLTVMQYVEADVVITRKKSPAAAAAARKPAAAATRIYVVKNGDTLAKIAQALLGNYKRSTDIAKLNNIRDPNRISVGQKLKIPS